MRNPVEFEDSETPVFLIYNFPSETLQNFDGFSESRLGGRPALARGRPERPLVGLANLKRGYLPFGLEPFLALRQEEMFQIYWFLTCFALVRNMAFTRAGTRAKVGMKPVRLVPCSIFLLIQETKMQHEILIKYAVIMTTCLVLADLY